MKCLLCNTENQNNSKFCRECGASLVEITSNEFPPQTQEAEGEGAVNEEASEAEKRALESEEYINAATTIIDVKKTKFALRPITIGVLAVIVIILITGSIYGI